MSDPSANIHKQAGAYFDRKAELFDSLYSPEKTSAFMRFLNKHFRSDIYIRYMMTMEHIKAVRARSVIDIGIGSGRYAQGYADAGVAKVVGVDISSGMLELARQYISKLGNGTKFELVLCDIDKFKSQEKFDVVVAMGFFDYVDNPLHGLNIMKDLCSQSVIASFPSISFYRTPIRKLRYKLKNCPVYFYSPADIEKLSEQAGFASCSIKKIPGAGMDYFVTMTIG